MKKLKCLLWTLAAVLLCSGCQAVTPAVDENGNIVADTYGSVKKMDASELKEVNIPADVHIICSYDDYVIYVTEVEGTSDEQSDNSYNISQLYRYDISKDKSEYVADLGKVFSVDDEAIYVNGKLYYPCVYESGKQVIFEIDIESKKVEKVFENNIWAPFYYVEKLDNSVIFFNITRPDAIQTKYTLYTIQSEKTERVKNIFETSASGDDTEGEFIVNIKTYNNKIYTYGAVYNSEIKDWDYHIKVYDIDGNQNADYKIDGKVMHDFEYMPDTGNYDSGWNFDIFDSYVMLHTLNSRIKMFKIEGTNLVNVAVPREMYKEEAGDFQMISKNASESGLMYAAACYLQEKNLYIFDTQGVKFNVYTVPLAEDESMNILYDTPDGELFIKIEQMTDEGYENQMIYMLDRNKL